MEKLKTSLTEAMVMFMMTRLVSWLERGLVFIKTKFCARRRHLSSERKANALLSMPADRSQFPQFRTED